jgi:dihydrofolate synthase / folylpolyglutamate synthase
MPTLLTRVDDLAAAMARLDSLTNWENRPRNMMRVGLEPMADLMARLGEPHKASRAVHVGGTKGKGSVSALIEAALVHAGLPTGRYGSPHVERVNERVTVNGRDVDDATLAQGLSRALDAYEAAKRGGTDAADATWFDLLTAAAFLIFRDAGVAWAVVEVGLGGRLDSTNVVNGEVAVITNIELEHTEVLGGTRAAIAREKGGILKPGATLVTSLGLNDDAGRVVRAIAAERGCEVVWVEVDGHETIELENVALAGAALDALGGLGVRGALGEIVSAPLLDAGTRATARLVGRMERIDIPVGDAIVPAVLDGAHVPFNIAHVLRDLSQAPDLAGPAVAVVALAADKDAAGFVRELGTGASTLVFTGLPSSTRGRSPEDMAAIAASLGLNAEVEPDPVRALWRGLALASERGAWLLVTGSLYLVGALRREALPQR